MRITKLARRIEVACERLQRGQQAKFGVSVFFYRIIGGEHIFSPGDRAQLEERQRQGLISILLPEKD